MIVSIERNGITPTTMDTKSYSFRLRSFQPEYCTISQKLTQFDKTTPGKNAFVFISQQGERHSLTCGELFDQAQSFAKGLIHLGIQKGQVIALGLPNIPEWPICTFGTILAGAVALNFMFNRKDASDIIKIFNAGSPSAILYHPGRDDNNVKIMQNLTEVSDDGNLYSTKVQTLQHFFITQKTIGTESYLTMEDIINLGKENSGLGLPELDPDDICMIMLTSGSTEIPKMVPWTHYRILSCGATYRNMYRSEDGDILFNDRPFNWIGGAPFYFLASGNTRVTIVDLFALKTPKDITDHSVRAIETEKCTIALLIAPCLLFMKQSSTQLNNEQWPLKVVATGGIPLASAFTSVIGTVSKTLVNVYGSTELGFMALDFISDANLFCDYSVGNPIEGAEMKVVNDNGAIVPQGEMGEIHVRIPERCEGYFNDPDRTKAHFTPSGWYKTDDVGIMRKDGAFLVQGRKSDVINCEGAKLIPLYLQQELKKHPSVLDVLVLPVADSEYYQVACACVMPYPTCVVTENELKLFLEDQYTLQPETYGMRKLTPKFYVIIENFPRTPVGKVDRAQVKEIMEKELSLRSAN